MDRRPRRTGCPDWVTLLYRTPATGQLVAMEQGGRFFEGKLADYLRLRDRRCRYCGASIRHLDHAEDQADGGKTSATNGQGLCEACNYAKQAPGWSARPRPGPGHIIETITPTGHRYLSYSPAFGSSLRMGIYPLQIRIT